jgi:hypothetical protein
MSPKLQGISIDEELTAIDNANGECPEKLSRRPTGSLSSQYRELLRDLPDQEYVRSMEERYGIREGCIF